MDNPFEPLEGAVPSDRGEPSISSREIAQEAARAAVGAVPPGGQFKNTDDEPQALPSEEAQYLKPAESDLDDPDAPPVDEPETPEETVERVLKTLSQEEYDELVSLGIDIPVAPGDVPEEFQDTYAAMAQALMDSYQASQARVLDAQEAILKVQDFAERLQTPEGQERLLLGMALNSGEMFGKVAEMVTRMQEDPEFKESVIRRLETDVRYETAVRKEKAIEQSQLEQKAQRIESRTTRMAQRLGVDESLAMEMVGARILQNEAANGKRDITVEEVDQIVNALARRTGAKPPKVKAPAQHKQEQATPQRPASAAGVTPGQPAPAAARPAAPAIPQSPQGARNALRSAITQAAQNVRSKGL